MASQNLNRPLGFPVAETTPAPRPSRITLQGRTATLEPLKASYAVELFSHVGGGDHAWLWDYMPGPPVTDVEEFRSMLAAQEKSEDPLFWVIKVPSARSSDLSSTEHGAVVGYISLLNIVPVHRTVEVGHIMYSPALQRTIAATEAVYLLARYVLRDLGYRRFEWKCNNLNEPSKKAALRYGFTYEGLFRQHQIVKGLNRDTAWFSILGSEWAEGTEAAFEQWLDSSNFDDQGKQKTRLEDFMKQSSMHSK